MADKTIPLIIIIACLILSVVLFRTKKNITAFALGFVTLFTAFWTLSIFLSFLQIESKASITASRLAFFFPILIVFSLFLFMYFFTPKSLRATIFNTYSRVCTGILFITGTLLLIYSLTPAIVEKVSLNTYQSTFGYMYPLYFAFICVSFGFIYATLIRGFRIADQSAKIQYQYILIGVGISSIWGIITNLVLPSFFHLELGFIGPLGVTFFLFFTAYAIKKHNLFSISKTGEYLSTYSKDIARNLSYGFSVLSDNEIYDAIKNYHDFSILEKSPFLNLKIIRDLCKRDNVTPVDAFRRLIKESIEYFKLDIVDPDRRTKQNLKYHILKMIAFDQAEEGQILWQLGFESYPVRIMQMESREKQPKFRNFSPADYAYTSRNAYLALKKEAIHDVTWRISYLEKLSKK